VSVESGNILRDLPAANAAEDVSVLLSNLDVRVVRIVSHGHSSPPGFWYDQDETEWVAVLAGAAGLLIEGEFAPRRLGPGDYVLIPPHVRHRVEWTAADQPTVWLAVHLTNGSDAALQAMLSWP
jgi:cupin 2 domain-containing protein